MHCFVTGVIWHVAIWIKMPPGAKKGCCPPPPHRWGLCWWSTCFFPKWKLCVEATSKIRHLVQNAWFWDKALVYVRIKQFKQFIGCSIGLFILWYFWTFKGLSRVFQGHLRVFQWYLMVFTYFFIGDFESILKYHEKSFKPLAMPLKMPLKVQNNHKMQSPMGKLMNSMKECNQW